MSTAFLGAVAALEIHDASARHFTHAEELERYRVWLKTLCMTDLVIHKLAERAGLEHRLCEIRASLLADPRFIRLPGSGPWRFRLLPEYRNAAKRERAAVVPVPMHDADARGVLAEAI